MAKEKKIQDYDGLYSFLRHYVDCFLKLSYRNIKYTGLENLPKDGAVIFAPNHTNALMDALVILAMDRSPKVYVARADIFKKPLLAKIFKFLKIMPIMRIRDGINEVKKNNETIEKAVDVLRDKVPFCIFPEGQHLAKHSAQPLAKGIFRIAFQAQELMPDMPLYIVPVGIRYGNFFRFRSTVRMHVGEPINVGDFMRENSSEPPQVQMNILKDILAERIKGITMYIPNDDDYNAVYEICAATVTKRIAELNAAREGGAMHPYDAHFEANSFTVREIARLKEQEPQKAAKVLELGHKAFALRNARRISLSSVIAKYPLVRRIPKTLLFIALFPYFLTASVAVLPINGVCSFLFTKLKDMAFRNSIRYLILLLMWPVLMIIYTCVAFSVFPWEWALAGILALVPSPVVAHELWRLIRLDISDFKLLTDKKLRNIYKQIADLMHNNAD